MKDNDIKITKKVRINVDEVMQERGLTQTELSELTKIRQASISQLSRGFVSRLSLEHIERIASALDIDDINEIITLVDDDK